MHKFQAYADVSWTIQKYSLGQETVEKCSGDTVPCDLYCATSRPDLIGKIQLRHKCIKAIFTFIFPDFWFWSTQIDAGQVYLYLYHRCTSIVLCLFPKKICNKIIFVTGGKSTFYWLFSAATELSSEFKISDLRNRFVLNIFTSIRESPF